MRSRIVVAIVVALVGLTAIALVQSTVNRHSIERDLTERTTRALRDNGIGGAHVTFVGRDGTVRVASGADQARVRRIVEGVDGVRVVSVTSAPAGQRPPSVKIVVDGANVTVTGTVPSEAALRQSLGSATFRLTVDPGTSDAGLSALAAVVTALGKDAGNATIELSGGTLTLSGTVASQPAKTAAATAAAAVVGDAANVVDRLVVAGSGQVQDQIGKLPRVTFENNSATLTPEGRAVVANVARILKDNPTVKISIEGHTDSNGSPEANLTLSRARAQTVLETLVGLGIAADRMTATGFGESRPKVPDTDAEAHAINRRVEFVVER